MTTEKVKERPPETAETAAPRQGAGEVVPHRDASLEIVSGQRWWTREQAAALASIGLEDTPDADKMAFLHLCQATGLDPFRREIYLIGRKSGFGRNQTVKWTAQTGIDGFRHIAERTGEYLGRSSPEWCGEDGVWKDVWLSTEPPAAARIKVRRRIGNEVVETVGTVMYREFCPMADEYEGSGDNRRKTGRKVPSGLWGTMPAHMLAKVAEAFAIRSAFPRQAGGVYLPEEMHKADEQEKAVKAAEQAEARRRAREEGAARPWAARQGVVLGQPVAGAAPGAGEPQQAAEAPPAATPAQDEDPDIVDAELVPPIDREALLAELDEQAKTLGQTRAAMLRRWTAQHRMNIEDAPDELLMAAVIEKREIVAWKRAEDAKAVGTPKADDSGFTGEPTTPDDPFPADA